MEHEGFPSDETLAAFIDGRLDAAARGRVIAHIATCDECYSIVVAAAEHTPPAAPTPFVRRRSRYPFLVAAVVVILVVIGGAWFLDSRRGAQRDVAHLLAAVDHRRIEGRIEGMRYLPLEPPRRAPKDVVRDPESWKLFGPASAIGARAKSSPTAAHLDALAVSHLILGNYDDAVTEIERALRADTQTPDAAVALQRCGDAQILSDAAAIYLARGRARQLGDDDRAAFEAAQRAWTIRRTPEIAWNRALATEALQRREDAAAAWRDYLALDASSQWAAEAKQHLAALQTPTGAMRWQTLRPQLARAAARGTTPALAAAVAPFARATRLWIEEELLPEWASLELRGDAAAASESLTRARNLARTLQQLDAGTLDADAIAAIDASSGDALVALARGHAAYKAGLKLFEGESWQLAAERFCVAQRDFGATPFGAAAAMYEAACHMTRDDYDGAVAMIAAREPRVASGHKALRAQMCWIRGLSELSLGHPDAAIELYQQAAVLFASAHEPESVAAMHSLLADADEAVGSYEAAAPLRARALEAIARSGDARLARNILAEAGYSALSAKRYATADLYLAHVGNTHAETGGSLWRCESLLWRSSLEGPDHGEIDRVALAARASAACGAIADPSVRQRWMANMAFTNVSTASTPAELIPRLDAALRFFRRTNNHLWIATLLDRRGRAMAALHDVAGAEASYRDGVEAMESVGTALDSDEARDVFLSGASDLYGDLLDLLLAQHRDDEAFDVAERGLALGGVQLPAARGLARRVREALPPGVAVVEYAVRPNELVTWLVRRDGVDVLRANVSSRELASLVAAEQLDALHVTLVAPWIDRVPAETTLVFVPDAALQPVPFSALRDAHGEYVAQRFATGVAASAFAFLGSVSSYRERAVGNDRALLVADPAFDAERFPRLERLTFARREVSAIAPLYPHALTLGGAAATKAAFLAEAALASIIHFAGHAVVNDVVPRYSALVFAPGAAGEGCLYAHELPAANFAHVRLAVLSACSTARGDERRRGTATLARALAAAGVPAVVATLWAVDDDAAALFARHFHQSIRNGRSPAYALRDAQLAMMQSADERLRAPRSWGAFRLIGAATAEREEIAPCPHCASSSQESAR